MGCSGNKSNVNTVSNETQKDKIKIKTANLIDKNLSTMRSQYKSGKKIGEGKFGKIFQVNHLSTNTKRTLKIINIKTLNQDAGKKEPNEISILNSVDHPSIIKLYEYFMEGQFFYVILENVEGKNISDYIVSKKLNEIKIASLMKEVVSCLIYLHNNNIIYRNIQPENVVVINDNLDIKLIGFSSATFLKNPKYKQSQSFGNFYFMAPEALKNVHEKKSDFWSCGVLLFFLLTGALPFYDDNSDKTMSLIQKGNYNKSLEVYSKLSNHSKDLIEKLLKVDPTKRLEGDQILSHPWFSQTKLEKNDNADQIQFQQLTKDKFKTAIEAFIVHQMANNEIIDKLRKAFKKCDTSCDGLISRDELKKMINKTSNQKYSDLELNELMDSIDIDNSGKISFEEFIRATISNDSLITKQNLQNAFNFFDKDKSGKLSVTEIKEVFGKKDNKDISNYIENVMKKYDKDGDGQLDFEEFVTLISSSK